MRDYFDNRWDGVTLGPEDLVRSPTAIANFTSQYAFEGDAPCEWAERLYNVQGWTPWSAVGISHPRKNQWLSAAHCSVFREFDSGNKGLV